jgi:hypothetical protein
MKVVTDPNILTLLLRRNDKHRGTDRPRSGKTHTLGTEWEPSLRPEALRAKSPFNVWAQAKPSEDPSLRLG